MFRLQRSTLHDLRSRIAALSAEWSLRHDVIEKDYVFGWLLAGIAAHPALAGWVFKGGTCLRKCYFETYRFSEDTRFHRIRLVATNLRVLASVFGEISRWIDEQCGLGLQVDDRSFRRQVNRRGNPTTRGRLALHWSDAFTEYPKGPARLDHR